MRRPQESSVGREATGLAPGTMRRGRGKAVGRKGGRKERGGDRDTCSILDFKIFPMTMKDISEGCRSPALYR